jgi:hypothetical protein
MPATTTDVDHRRQLIAALRAEGMSQCAVGGAARSRSEHDRVLLPPPPSRTRSAADAEDEAFRLDAERRLVELHRVRRYLRRLDRHDPAVSAELRVAAGWIRQCEQELTR